MASVPSVTTGAALPVVAATADGVLALFAVILAVELAIVLRTVAMPAALANAGRLFATAVAAMFVAARCWAWWYHGWVTTRGRPSLTPHPRTSLPALVCSGVMHATGVWALEVRGVVARCRGGGGRG